MSMFRSIIVALTTLAFSSFALAENLPTYTDAAGHKKPASGIVILSPSGAMAGRPTYSAVVLAYGAYATPTDLFCLWGSATKIVKVAQSLMYIQSSAAALQTIMFIRRSTVNTGGTPTNPTVVKLDSTNPAPTATFTQYGAAPTLGTTVGTFAVNVFASATLTTAPVVQQFSTFVIQGNRQTDNQGFILRGVNEGVCWNYAGVALTAGWVSNFVVSWSEE